MNPFDLRGPEFLGFYLLASAVGLLWLYGVSRGLWSNSSTSPSGSARRQLRDPYLLAYLRAGVREMLMIAAFSLNKRRLLNSAGASLMATQSEAALHAVRNPLELALLSRFHSLSSVTQLLEDERLKLAAENYAQPLRQSGLIADDKELSRRRPVFLLVTAALAALASIKLYVAVQRGHWNVFFLIILALVMLAATYAIWRRRRTGAGDRALADQQTLFIRLKGRVKRLGVDDNIDEAVLVAAAYGLRALPGSAYPFADRLRREPSYSYNRWHPWYWHTHCGTSCGSSCASRSGSSCGGGGGSGSGSSGGGCGGCGS